jgi:hypothetical protein
MSENKLQEAEEDQATNKDSAIIARWDATRATELLRWVGVAVLALTAVVALVGLYNGVMGSIRIWVSDPYQPLFRAAFNLTLLLAAVGGLGLLTDRF